MKKQIIVNGMSCGHCKARVEAALGVLVGVTSVVADPKAGTVDILTDATVTDEELLGAVNALGFEAVSIADIH